MNDDLSKSSPNPSVSNHHPIGYYFIFWGEFAERCSYYGMRAILATYMSKELGLGEANAGTYMSFFIAACYFLPLVGGYIADNFFGKYWTIIGFSAPYILGQLLVGFPNNYVFFGSLILLAMGSGVIKPNISTLMGMSYDQQRPGKSELRASAFAYFYVAINIGAALGQNAVPEMKDKYGYQSAFMLPAAFMAIAMIIFALGKKYYAVEKIERKKLTSEDISERIQFFKKLSGLFLPIMFFWAAYDQTASTWVFFGQTYMHENLLGYNITAERLQSLNAILIIVLTPVLRIVFSTLDKKKMGVPPTVKLAIGFLFTAVACGILAFAGSIAGTANEQTVFKEGKEIVEKVVLDSEKVSLWWMVLAYFVLTIGELLISATGLELAFVIAPANMKGFVTACFLLMVWAGNLIVNAPYTRMYSSLTPAVYFGILGSMVVAAGIVYCIFLKWFMKSETKKTAA
ncbi:MAG: oligopeptide:H+ symporter [Gemmataceae bacterium]